MVTWNVIFDNEVATWYKQVMIWVSVLLHRSVEMVPTAHRSIIIKQIRLHSVTEKRTKVEIVLAARELSYATQELIFGTLWV